MSQDISKARARIVQVRAIRFVVAGGHRDGYVGPCTYRHRHADNRRRRYSDAQLQQAIAVSISWRDTLRHLGLAATSSSAITSVRRHADRLGLNYRHFTGARRWSDAELVAAIREAGNWTDAARRLELTGGSAVATLQRHAARLRLDVAHFGQHDVSESPGQPDVANLSRSGSMIAAAWYSKCGMDVSRPLEPCRYDLLVSDCAVVRRVQVKTTVTASEQGVWQVNVSTTGRHDRKIYTPDEVDDFFIIDGDLNFYVVPIEDLLAMHAIRLSAYQQYRVRQVNAHACPSCQTRVNGSAVVEDRPSSN